MLSPYNLFLIYVSMFRTRMKIWSSSDAGEHVGSLGWIKLASAASRVCSLRCSTQT